MEAALLFIVGNMEESAVFFVSFSDGNGPCIDSLFHFFHAFDGTVCDEFQERFIEERLSISHFDCNLARHFSCRFFTKGSGSEIVFLLEKGIEPPDAPKAGGIGHVGHGNPRIRQKFLRQEKPAGLEIFDGSHAEFLMEYPPEMTVRTAQNMADFFDWLFRGNFFVKHPSSPMGHIPPEIDGCIPRGEFRPA